MAYGTVLELLEREQDTSVSGQPLDGFDSVAGGLLHDSLDATKVNIAILDIMKGLGATLDQTPWISARRLGDVIGPRNVFAWGSSLFPYPSARREVSS
jgi:hypothetical protein